jgi:hypothetical protein
VQQAARNVQNDVGGIMRRFIILAAVAIILVAAIGVYARRARYVASTTTPASAMAVPAQYKDLHGQLAALLQQDETLLQSVEHDSAALAGQRQPRIVFGAELPIVNANRGTALLNPATVPANYQYLQALKRLGVRGVTMAISYPVLIPSFPDHDRYLAVYRQVAAQVRQLGMTLDVESHVIFTDTTYSTIKFDFSKVPYARFESEMHGMIQTIIDQLHPTYLNVLGEPDTMTRLTGYRQVSDLAGSVQYLQTVLAGIKRGKTLIGAGNGTWLSPDYAQSFAALPSIDFIALHFYPLTTGTMRNAMAMVQAAQQHHKRVIMDELWLYKSTGSRAASTSPRQGIGSTADVFRLDHFSFWQPQDQQYLDILARFARAEGIEYISPFWSMYFFGYLAYNSTTANMSYRELVQINSQAILHNLKSQQVSQTGTYYKRLIARYGT